MEMPTLYVRKITLIIPNKQKIYNKGVGNSVIIHVTAILKSNYYFFQGQRKLRMANLQRLSNFYYKNEYPIYVHESSSTTYVCMFYSLQ